MKSMQKDDQFNQIEVEILQQKLNNTHKGGSRKFSDRVRKVVAVKFRTLF
jgi:hypothetical protein